jgi:periplasmic protein TonB
METKKNPRIDLEKKRPLFIQLGLLVSLSVVLFAFELKQFDRELMVITNNMAGTDLEEMMIQTERQQEPPPPAPQTITTMLEIVDDDTDILDEIEINIEINRETILAEYTPPVEKEEEIEEEIIYQFVEQQASFPGGETEMRKWLAQNLTYPPQAREAGIEGVVYVEFVVEPNGSITNVAIRHSMLGGGTEEAAMEAVKKMPKWNAGRQRNRPVRSMFVLPIQFQLAR